MIHSHLTAAGQHPSSTLATRLAGTARGAWRRYWDWRARKVTVEILRALDNRTLRDIGLCRSEIESVVHDRHGGRRPGYDENWLWHLGA